MGIENWEMRRDLSEAALAVERLADRIEEEIGCTCPTPQPEQMDLRCDLCRLRDIVSQIDELHNSVPEEGDEGTSDPRPSQPEEKWVGFVRTETEEGDDYKIKGYADTLDEAKTMFPADTEWEDGEFGPVSANGLYAIEFHQVD